MSKYVCTVCGYIYDEAVGIPERGIALGTKWADLPEDWGCPLCKAPKSAFKQESTTENAKKEGIKVSQEDIMREMTLAEMSALCSNLQKGCEKQYLVREAEIFHKLSVYYKTKAGVINDKSVSDLICQVSNDLEVGYSNANTVVDEKPDRGAKRALVWSEKVTRMLAALLAQYDKEKDSMLENTNIYICEICGFIYIGEVPPEICPVCKVPNKKLTKIEKWQ